MTWSWQVYTCQDHNLFYTTHDDHNCSLLYVCAVMHCVDDGICFLSGHLLCNPHICHMVSLSLPIPAFYVTLWFGCELESFCNLVLPLLQNYFWSHLPESLPGVVAKKIGFISVIMMLTLGKCLCFVLIGAVWVTYKIGSVLCCWVSLFVCVCILNCYLWFTCFYYLCSALVLTLLLQRLLCIGWAHSDIIGIKLEFCRVMV
jgi:hypothetical protein